MEIIGPDGTPMPVIRVGDLEGWEDEEEYEPTIEDILDDLEEFYEFNQPDGAEDPDEDYDPPATPADIQGYHLSEFITDYWENEVWGGETASIGQREFIIDSVQDLYGYLAEQGHIPTDAAKRVEQAVATLFRQTDELTPISR
jgi:hypothetical protein